MSGGSDGALREAVRYFRENRVLGALMDVFVKKYGSLGRLSGTATIDAPSVDDRRILGGFFRKDFVASEPLRISYRQFAAAWEQTKFAAVPLASFAEHWAGGVLESNKEREARKAEMRARRIGALRASAKHLRAERWLCAVLEHADGTQAVQKYFEEDDALPPVRLVMSALAALPEKVYMRLPIFAHRTTGDPHAFDAQTEAGSLLYHALRFLQSEKHNVPLTFATRVEAENALLYEFYLLKDDILNFATCVGLRALDSADEIAYWREAARINAPMNLPLREIARVARLTPYSAKWGADAYPVYVVENSGVFSALLDALPPSEVCPPLVCLHGQCKLASWALLDRLAAGGATLYYSGDFDPEGLQIAQKILERYGTAARLWHFSSEDYANPTQPLPDRRWDKLRSIRHPDLADTANLMQEVRLALYQEALLPQLRQDLLGGAPEVAE